eukprot:10649827-Alexandrium_andersonii.AAC.1
MDYALGRFFGDRAAVGVEAHLVAGLRQGGNRHKRALRCGHLELDPASTPLFGDEPQLCLAEVGDRPPSAARQRVPFCAASPATTSWPASSRSGMTEAAAPESMANCAFTYVALELRLHLRLAPPQG